MRRILTLIFALYAAIASAQTPPTIQHAAKVQIKPTAGAYADTLRIFGGLYAGVNGNVPVIDINGNIIAGGTIGPGSAPTPGVAPATDPDTGWWWPGSNQLAASMGGVERARFDSGGKFGLNTASPGQRLHIYEATSQVGIRLERHDQSTYDILVNNTFQIVRVGGQKLFFDDTGLSVGTGVAATTRLDIGGSAHISGDLTLDGFFNNALIPAINDTYNIGSPTKFWAQQWVSQINATIFAENVIQITGGWQIIGKNSGTLGADVSMAATTIDFGKSLGTVPLWVLIKSHDTSGNIKAEYIQVTSLSSGTTYNVSRDVTTLNSPDPAWAMGTPYLVLGIAGDGRIQLYASSGLAQISVLQQGATAAATNELVRLGGLDGMPGMSGSPGRYGIYIGTGTTNFLKYQLQPSGSPTGDDAKLIVGGTIQAGAGFFGDSTNRVTVEAAGLNLGTTGSLRSGQTAYQTGTGFWMGLVSGTYKFSIGNGSTTGLFWDGTTLTLKGDGSGVTSLDGGNIQTGTITAGKLNVATLSAITANLGTITAGTVTGATLQTASSGARVVIDSSNGLRGLNSGGTTQVQLSNSTGTLLAGAGNTILDSTGISIAMNTSSSWSDSNALRFTDSANTGERIGMGLYYDSAFGSGTYRTLELVNGGGSAISEIVLRAHDPTGNLNGSATSTFLRLIAGVSGVTEAYLHTLGPFLLDSTTLAVTSTSVNFGTSFTVSMNNSATTPGHPWLRSDGINVVLNAHTNGTLGLAVDQSGGVVSVGKTLIPSTTGASDFGGPSNKWANIYFSEPTTTTSGLFPLVTASGRIMAKSNALTATITFPCAGTVVFDNGLAVSKTGTC